MSDRIKEILIEFGKGCSNGKAGECSDCLDAAVGAIKSHLGWQPFKTAPKDVKPFLAWVMGEEICIVQWSVAGNFWLWDGDVYGNDIPDYTHWMPLPPTPST